MENYYFVDEQKITFKREYSQLGNYEDIYQHFMNYDEEICYVLDNGKVLGIISIGDLYRYYSLEKNTPINSKFTYLEKIDYANAEKIFKRIASIHEIPVIRGGKLLGCIRSKEVLSESGWIAGRKTIEEGHCGAYQWKSIIMRKAFKKINCNVYTYALPRYNHIKDKLSEEEVALYKSKMCRKNNIFDKVLMSEKEKDVFWGSVDNQYVSNFANDINKLKMNVKSGIAKINNIDSAIYQYKDGYRFVPNVSDKAKKCIYTFGPCIVAGGYVENEKTIQSYLQEMINSLGYNEYKIMNCGLCSPDYVWSRVLTEKIGNEDIVIIVDDICMDYQKSEWANNIQYKGNLSDVYSELDNPILNTIDGDLAHCNHIVNKKIAEKFFRDIQPSLTHDCSKQISRVAIQDYYIPWDVVSYYREYCEKYQLINNGGAKCGAIVMNCNPFTKGHRYLIEQAAAQVDLLYVFVVEEDKSIFKFADRIEMVRRGTADLENVKVLPSGRYIISKETFSQYFEKDNVELIEDMDYDVRIFGEVVAKEIGITVRFVGEEPFDKVTKQYNETMKRILPEYDIKVVEISRTTTEDGIIISASTVRKAMEEKDDKLLYKMLPETTLEYLRIGK